LPLNNNSDSGDHHQDSHGLLELNLGFLPDDALSLLFYASDTVIMPYSVASASGVMFDALAHGLPFVASDLGFFKEFARKGLGIAVRRNPFEFSEALKMLESDYPHYKKEVERFKSNLNWDSVAKQHVEIYTRILAKRHEFRSVIRDHETENPLGSVEEIKNELLDLNIYFDLFCLVDLMSDMVAS